MGAFRTGNDPAAGWGQGNDGSPVNEVIGTLEDFD